MANDAPATVLLGHNSKARASHVGERGSREWASHPTCVTFFSNGCIDDVCVCVCGGQVLCDVHELWAIIANVEAVSKMGQ